MMPALYVATDLRSVALPEWVALTLASPPGCLWHRFPPTEVASLPGGAQPASEVDVPVYLLTPALFATIAAQVAALDPSTLPPDRLAAALARWEAIDRYAWGWRWKLPDSTQGESGAVPIAQRLPDLPCSLSLLLDVERAVAEQRAWPVHTDCPVCRTGAVSGLLAVDPDSPEAVACRKAKPRRKPPETPAALFEEERTLFEGQAFRTPN